MTADEARALRMVDCIAYPWEVQFVNVTYCITCRDIVILECPSLTVADHIAAFHNSGLDKLIAAERRKSKRLKGVRNGSDSTAS